MPIDAGIYQLLGMHPAPNPMQGMLQGVALQQHMQGMQENALKMQMMQRDYQAQLAIADAFKQEGVINEDGSLNHQRAYQEVASRGFADRWPKIEDELTKVEQARATIAKTRVETEKDQQTINTAHLDYLGGLARVSQLTDYDPDLLSKKVMLAIAQNRLYPSEAAPILQAVQNNDTATLHQLVDAAVTQSPQQNKEQVARIEAGARATTAATAAARLSLEGPEIAARTREATARAATAEALQPLQVPKTEAEIARTKAETAKAGVETAKAGIDLQMMRDLGFGAGPTTGKPRTPEPQVKVQVTGEAQPRVMRQSAANDFLQRVRAAGGNARIVP